MRILRIARVTRLMRTFRVVKSARGLQASSPHMHMHMHMHICMHIHTHLPRRQVGARAAGAPLLLHALKGLAPPFSYTPFTLAALGWLQMLLAMLVLSLPALVNIASLFVLVLAMYARRGAQRFGGPYTPLRRAPYTP